MHLDPTQRRMGGLLVAADMQKWCIGSVEKCGAYDDQRDDGVRGSNMLSDGRRTF